MKLTITANKTIKEIQEEFQHYFPYLTIEFFSKPHRSGEPSAAKDIYKHTKTIKEISTSLNEGVIPLSNDMTVRELEEILEKQYGLHAQIFRKQHLDWIETTTTDNWTLQKQNETGKEFR